MPDRLGWLVQRRIIPVYQRLRDHGGDIALDAS
jgi:hypothetical protein